MALDHTLGGSGSVWSLLGGVPHPRAASLAGFLLGGARGSGTPCAGLGPPCAGAAVRSLHYFPRLVGGLSPLFSAHLCLRSVISTVTFTA